MFAGFDPEMALYDDDPDFLSIVRRSVVKADSHPVVSIQSRKSLWVRYGVH
jgi:hypothetical protein